ncbi:c6 zinc finger domain-containing protein [Moniliophthora roreri MCA 2997]|uniref:C6 zinc finger domain-containing protein n=1 Tax=Moniliophthora roreri (strain MCA 2997) TaxID=1381753 RepID=V2X8D1_MONRO|nr:c6 zinc finger domain-containing protein [Moniliophthora roreri MCA 2997]KAI3596585.1 c6 zinc finger domain-containing protein [Moniliophthora roreri]
MSTPSTSGLDSAKRVIRLHVKSRTGCITCKKRRIKCDETEPKCNHCLWRNIECVWKKTKSTDNPASLAKPLSAPRPIPINITSLRLIHHFAVASASTYCSDPEYTDIITIAIPQISWYHPHLLHAMLSCTALHLGRLYSNLNSNETNWISLASAHRKAAIAAFPSAMNLDAKFITVGFFSVYTISSSLSSSPENIFSMVTSLHNVWSALRGRRMYEDDSLKDLDPFVAYSGSEAVSKALGPLQHIYDPSQALEPEELLDSGIREAYRVGVGALYVAYQLNLTGFESKAVVVWPALFGKWFLALLNARKQRALVVLYFYAIMLRDVSEKCWWANEAERCLEYVYGMLDTEWRDRLNKMYMGLNISEGRIYYEESTVSILAS